MTEAEISVFREQGFTQAQIEEIALGVDGALHYEIYAKKELMPQQMYQIRLGLENGVDMHQYATPEYDWFQLEEIRLGMEQGLMVSKYDSPDLNSKLMHEMRRGLENKMDLSDFLKYDSKIITQVREALLSHVDILNYVEAGFDAEQLYEIRVAMEEGIDIQQYVLREFWGVTLHEIVEGLRNQIDVEIYAKPCYSWSQMREIRLGLESQIDVKYYLSPLYNRYQMEQIRLGLEDGLEVDEYASLMYPAASMERMRYELKEHGTFVSQSFESLDGFTGDAELGEENRDGISVTVSPDDMVAYIRVNRAMFGSIARKDILRSLRVMGITQNIDHRMVDNILSGKHLGEVVQIAAGQKPVDGADGYYEFFFDTNKVRAPKILPDGSADFLNMEWYEQARRGQKLAYYHSAGNGEEGHTVTGKRLSPKKGKEKPSLHGKGFVIQPDKKTYISIADGKVELKGNNLEVTQILSLKDANQSVGNIRFEGNINIAGDVGTGIVIEAGGDVVINGFVENCVIKAKGDVVLKKGINGSDTGSIEAGGNVEAKFFERVNIRAGKSIKANYSLHSNLYAEESIEILGGKGLILGGHSFATKTISVACVGNEIGVRTVVKMGVSEELISIQRRIESDLVDKDNKLLILHKGLKDLQDKYPPEIRNAMETYIKIEDAIYTINKEKEELRNEKEKVMQQISDTAEASMNVSKTLYDNVMIDIDGKKMLSTLSSNVTVKKVEDRVGIYKNE